jgi:glycosyltransferase involved in cell wall biosynthesis
MKVAFISRWGVQCGIATYTDQLVQALTKAGINCECVAEELSGMPQIPVQSDIVVTRCWRGKESSYNGIFKHIIRQKPSIIHLQHEFGLMDCPEAMLNLMPKISNLGIPVIVTCHTVMPPPSHKGWFFRQTLSQVAGVVAHNGEIKKALIDWRIPPKNIFIISHGTPENCDVEDKVESRRALYLPEDPNVVIALSLGFITPGKMQHEATEAIIELVQEGLLDSKHFLYVIAGSPGDHPENIKYCRKLYHQIDEARAWNYIRITPSFIATDDLPIWYGAGDFVITGSHQTFYSVSGRAHQEMAYKIPSISSRARLLSDLNSMRSMKYDSKFQLRSHILRMVGDPQLRSILSGRCGDFANETSWTNVAKKHIDAYKSLLARKPRMNARSK